MEISGAFPPDSSTTQVRAAASHEPGQSVHRNQFHELIVILFAAAIFLGGVTSPPSLMDDVDAAQAQVARTMLTSGDWVTGRLDGVIFLDKAPLKYWMTVICYKVFGVHDWSARLPGALAAIVLAWVMVRFGRWAFSPRIGFYAGLLLATCVGLFLFTRIVIPDVLLTLSITLGLWSLLRALDESEAHSKRWAYAFWITLAAGMLLKGLIGVVFPLGIAFVYLLFTRQLFVANTWRRLRTATGLLLFLLIAAPWHILAILHNPPYFDFTLHGGPGEYRGFFWFYFINDQLLRFFNARYPRDYNTVPRLAFWLLHFAWLFPWSVYFFSSLRVRFGPLDRAGRARTMALCWAGFVLLFFTFSTTQEYYSMPAYPALALLLAIGMAAGGKALDIASRVLGVVLTIGVIVGATLLIVVRHAPTPQDISYALSQHSNDYTLSLGHMQDLNIAALAYLRLPLAVAVLAGFIGAIGAWFGKGERRFLTIALMMVIFCHAARLALVVFDPFLSSRPLAEALNRSPKGTLIINGPYYTFSSVFFYTGETALILNGRETNLEYGSYAPDAPPVFIGNRNFVNLWNGPRLQYLAVEDEKLPDIEKLVNRDTLHKVVSAGGKSLYANRPVLLSQELTQASPVAAGWPQPAFAGGAGQ